MHRNPVGFVAGEEWVFGAEEVVLKSGWIQAYFPLSVYFPSTSCQYFVKFDIFLHTDYTTLAFIKTPL